ncbi:acyloxyacyl hydrolase [Desertibaculum subflavum]|uniref:acyloxyacyl hydrolase n=1 Tax=Desertibaculum subflavum TaxID=2268458 RepID=UPI0013C3E4B3
MSKHSTAKLFPTGAALLAAALFAAAPAMAQSSSDEYDQALQGFELRLGLLEHDVGLLPKRNYEDGLSINGELAFAPLGSYGRAAFRPVIGGSVSTEGRTNFAYADMRAEVLWDRIFFGVGLGAAIHDSKLRRTAHEKDLGSRVLFHVPAEVGFQITPNNRLSVYYEHLTNFGLDKDNQGLDNLGVRFAHRF